MVHIVEIIFDEEIVKMEVETEAADASTNTNATLRLLEPIFEDSHTDEFRTQFLQHIAQNERAVINQSWEDLANQ